MVKTCVGCGNKFETNYPRRVYCNDTCRIKAKALRVNPRAKNYVRSFQKQGEMIGHARRMIQAGHERIEILESIASTFHVSDTISENYYQQAKKRVEILERVRV